jgi:hypothetical protein
MSPQGLGAPIEPLPSGLDASVARRATDGGHWGGRRKWPPRPQRGADQPARERRWATAIVARRSRLVAHLSTLQS